VATTGRQFTLTGAQAYEFAVQLAPEVGHIRQGPGPDSGSAQWV
jgi:hypothetical protein